MIHERFSENYSRLRVFAREAPPEPGVYLWRDSENRIIYVGKAINLKNRLNSYFSGPKDVKTAALISHSKAIETIIVSNEYEALLLENTLIKQHSPRYNINLKDGKTYPVVRITFGDFPRVFRTRHIVEDGSQYFGPFPNVQVLDETLAVIEKLFPLRKCRTMKKRENPCMYYHINRCLAPCCGRVEEPAYNAQVERVRKLLAGETSALVCDLSAQMQAAAEALKFEEAAGFRNAIRAIESLSENNSVADMDPENRDYIAWAEEGVFTTFSVLSMRGGRMTGRELFNSRSAANEDESLVTFLAAYYSPDRPPPPRIYLTGLSVQVDALDRYFREQFGYTPELIWQEGLEKRHIAALSMARQNAQEELKRRLRERGAGPALDELKRILSLKARPERIEGFDIAQLEGRHPVASLISFKNGVPDRKNYRYFKLRTVVGIVDDFASIREAVQRRYARLVREGLELPDLVLIDGGIGQVNAARGVMDELGIDCDVVGLAKREEEIWLPHAAAPIVLSERSEALKVLQHVRDETHRFATGLNQRLRSGDLYFPVLESIEGIGPKRAANIMKAYGNLEKITAADPQEIAEKCGVSPAVAKAARSAVRLAIEEREAKKKKLSISRFTSSDSAADLAAEAFAAEETPDYKP
jgi:excinuclease ABC subunit C